VDQQTILITILGMTIVTYLPRLLPMTLLSSRKLPDAVVTWLRYVPVAVLAAMLLPALLAPEGQIDLSRRNVFLWAALPTFYIAWKKRSLFGSVILGMALVALARWLIG